MNDEETGPVAGGVRWGRLRNALVLVLSAVVAIGVSCAFVAFMLPPRLIQAGPGGQPVARTPEEARILFTACVIFYATAYGSARRLYRVFGSHDDAEDVRDVAGQHLPFLNLIASVWLVASSIEPIRRGTARPLDWAVLVVGGLWVPICLRQIFLALRRYQPFGWTFGAKEPDPLSECPPWIPAYPRHRDEGP